MGPERQHHRVIVGRRLQLEVEALAELLAQGEAERAVEAPAPRCVDPELHAARIVEEALEHEPIPGRQSARGARDAEITRDLDRRVRARHRSPTRSSDPAGLCLVARRARASARDPSAARHLVRQLLGSRGASPAQKGTLGVAPSASTTRSLPASTRRIRQVELPSRKTSPGRLSIAKSSPTVPMKVSSGSATTR